MSKLTSSTMTTIRSSTHSSRFGLALLLVVSHMFLLLSTTITPVDSFALVPTKATSARTSTTIVSPPSSTIQCRMAPKSTEENTEKIVDEKKNTEKKKVVEKNPEITKQLERAKAALAGARAKMEAREQAEAGIVDDEGKEKNGKKESVPFFAMNAADENGKKEKVIKDKNEDGLFTTDGDLMAKLSEEEEWESRPLMGVFKNEREEEPDPIGINADIGQNMYNLRKSLQTEDFGKIFDKRNYFIGDA